jgi:CPA2 family monovalent cation:H+ antiporter-2
VTARISTTMLVRFEPGQPSRCSHLDAIGPVTPSAPGCEDCLSIGVVWIHLRICMSCGHVGCCDDSRNQHARAHHERTGHPVVRSLEPGETWGWCYLDDTLLPPAQQTQPSVSPSDDTSGTGKEPSSTEPP